MSRICFKIIAWKGEWVEQDWLRAGNCCIWVKSTWGFVIPPLHFCMYLRFFHKKFRFRVEIAEASGSGLKLLRV